MDIVMHEGMDGPHLFEIPLKSNDAAAPLKKLQVASNWVPR